MQKLYSQAFVIFFFLQTTLIFIPPSGDFHWP